MRKSACCSCSIVWCQNPVLKDPQPPFSNILLGYTGAAQGSRIINSSGNLETLRYNHKHTYLVASPSECNYRMSVYVTQWLKGNNQSQKQKLYCPSELYLKSICLKDVVQQKTKEYGMAGSKKQPKGPWPSSLSFPTPWDGEIHYMQP